MVGSNCRVTVSNSSLEEWIRPMIVRKDVDLTTTHPCKVVHQDLNAGPLILPEAHMNHLDRLEAQSVYILREAFNRIDKLAMLWSLGKDSNVMVWLAKKAFFGHVPFPVMHIDTEKKFPEMYAFRDRYVAEWHLNLIADKCPPVEEMDPTLPPAARSAARKTPGLVLEYVKRIFRNHLNPAVLRCEPSARRFPRSLG